MYYGLEGNGWDDATMMGGDEVRGHSTEDEPTISIEAGDDSVYRECSDCGNYIEEDAPESQRPDEDEELHTFVDGHDDDCVAHDWRAPESIGMHFNGAGVRITDEENCQRVQVWISIGDPRGAFCMNLERVNGELRLSVPHAEMGMSHMTLTPIAEQSHYMRVG